MMKFKVLVVLIAQNDKFFVILTLSFLVILSAAKYPQNQSVDFSPFFAKDSK
mgnify:CR=1 FL=1